MGPSHEVQNVTKSAYWFLPEVRRVAVLPLTCQADRSEAEAGRNLLGPVVLDELGKSRRFEVIAVSSEKLQAWTGQTHWNAEEPLSPKLLDYLRVELACDAVLFSRLTRFHAYPPMVQGYSFKLLTLSQTPGVLEVAWAVDEVFDASDPMVVNGARRYEKAGSKGAQSLSGSRFILNSPTRFGHYSLEAIFATLPER